MKRRIYKVSLVVGTNVIYLPRTAVALTAQYQGRELCLWYMFDLPDDNTRAPRKFLVVGTGFVFDAGNAYRYIAAVQEPPFVWHVLELEQENGK